MALTHDGGIEIACNLLDLEGTGPEAVLAQCRELALAHDAGEVASAYRIGKSVADLASVLRDGS